MGTLDLKILSEAANGGTQGPVSTLKSQSIIHPVGYKKHVNMASALVLTSLIDAFVILTSYLLMAASIGLETIEVPKDMQLPQAQKSDILEKGIVIMVHNDQYFINDQPVRMDQLGEKLLELKKATPNGETTPVIIQADKHTNFMKLNPAVLSGLQAGFQQIRFAVKQEDGY